MDKDIKASLKSIVDKFLGKEDVDKIIKEEVFNEIDITNICEKIFTKEEDNEIINQDVIIDLELFEGLGVDKNNNIFNYINKTQTKLGSFLLKKILVNPTDNTELLKSRQIVIQKFNNNAQLFQELDNKMSLIKEKEDDLLWLWKETSDETKQLFGMVYFQKRFLKFLNHNEFAMKIYNYYIIIFSPLYGILSPILMVLAPFIFIKY